ncbi:MAG TPA: hypothetical protein VIL47_01570 [Candidatus Bipolaricaulota bacterium]
MQHEVQAKVQVVPSLHDCYDYACGTCKKVYRFYDQALDCMLSHKLERLGGKAVKHHRDWTARRY